MGLFDKIGGKGKANDAGADVKKTKKSKVKVKPEKAVKGGKKPKKEKKARGKKKEMTLLERMQLEESVASASLDVVQDLASMGGSAVRETDDGLLIVAFTNEMLEDAGLDPASEEFGSFAEALRSETIESIALADDLASGVVGIIPSQETLLSLDEFDFVRDTAFKWAIVPYDLTDEDRLMVLDSEVHIEKLVQMSNDPSIQFEIRNGEAVEIDGGDGGYESEYDDADEPEDDGGLMDDGEDEFEGDAPGYGGGLDEPEDDFDEGLDDEPLDDMTDGFDGGFGEDGFDEGPDADFDPGFDDGEFDDFTPDGDMEPDGLEPAASFDEVDEGLTAEESKEAINRVVQHSFNNTELDLSIDMTKFDDYFDSITIAQFDTTGTDGSELQNTIVKLRQDANAEIQRFHQDNMQSLRNKYTTSMRDIHNKLVESLDHKDRNTTYGSRFFEIETDFEDKMDDIDRLVAGEIGQINSEYNEQREEFAENAKREAYAVYDSRYRDERNRKVESVKDRVQTDLKTDRDTKFGELYDDRRIIAKRLFDKAMTSLLRTLQDEYQRIAQKELQMFDAFRKDLDTYYRKHFADDVLRSKAEAEKQKQSHEAERVRQEYEQLLITKARQAEEADKQAKEALRQLDSSHKEQIDEVRADYERRIEREQRDNKELRELLRDANQANSKIAEQKEDEVQHRMKVLEDQVAAKEKELEYANERAKSAQKPVTFILVAIGAVMLALGIIFGFMFGAAQTKHLAPAAPEYQQNAPVSYHMDTTADEIGNVVDFSSVKQNHAA